MTSVFVISWCLFGKHARMRERIEGNADFEGLLLTSHTHNFGHESLQQFFLPCSNWRTLAVVGHRESKNVDHAPDTVFSIGVPNFDVILAQLNLDNSCQVPTDRHKGMQPGDVKR